MSWELYAAFVAATAGFIALPGPSVVLTVSQGMTHGFRRTVASVAGTGVAVALQLGAVALGIGTLLAMETEAFAVLRWAGVAYLTWLAVRQWRAPVDAGAAPGGSKGGLFWQGFVTSGTNPKSFLFYGAFFPQFLDPNLPRAPQLALLCITFLVIAVAGTAGYAAMAHQVRPLLRRPELVRLRNRLSATLLALAGVGLALVRT